MLDVEQFRDLFSGFEAAYGYYNVEPTGTAGEKQLGDRGTKSEPVTTELWEQHLQGEQGLGIVPVNEQGVCRWGCIDIDLYSINHQDLIRRIESHGLPLVVCRTKSGGAHVFIFANAPVPAEDVQGKLRELAAGLGFGKSEVFPKQNRVLLERNDVGSWLNLPYFDHAQTMRYGFNEKGEALDLEQFLAFARARRLGLKAIKSLAVATDITTLEGGPPCLQFLIGQGFPDGTRNQGLFNLGVFARKKYPDDWREKVAELNKLYMKPPLDYSEVSVIIKSLERKEYDYKCNEPPIRDYCNQSLCKMRMYGVGSMVVPAFGSLTKLKTTPPIWFLDVDGKRIELATEQLMNQRLFQLRCVDELNAVFPVLKATEWEKMVSYLLSQVEQIEVPEEIGPEGQLRGLLLEYLSFDKVKNFNRAELLNNRPWVDEEEARVCFRFDGFMLYLSQQKYKELNRRQVYATLRKLNIEQAVVRVDKHLVRVYCVPVGEVEGLVSAIPVPAIQEEVM